MLPTIIQADFNTEPLSALPGGLQVMANIYSTKYGVSPAKVKKIVTCESHWNINAVNHTSIEYSVGLVQINLKAHPGITIDQAKDPDFVIS